MKGGTSRYEIEVSISLAMENRPSSAISAHLSFVHTRGGCGIVLVVSPRRMMEMDDEIAVVRNDRPVEGNGSDVAPIAEGAPLAKRWAVRLPVIGNLDVERKRAFRPEVGAVVDLRHDLVAEVESRALDSGLVRRHRETHESWRARGLALRLSKLRNLVELADAWFSADEEDRTSPPYRIDLVSGDCLDGAVLQFDLVSSVFEHSGKWHPLETRGRCLAGARDPRPLLCGMCRGQPIPVVVEHLRQIFRDLPIVEDQAGVSVGFDALVRPIVTTEHHDLAIHDDRLVVAARLETENLAWKSHGYQAIQALLFHQIAAYDADIASFVDFLLQGANQEPELVEVFVSAAEIDVLVLEPHTFLCRADQVQRMLGVIVRRQERLHAYLTIDSFRLEKLRGCRKGDGFFRFFLRHEQVRRCSRLRLPGLR